MYIRNPPAIWRTALGSLWLGLLLILAANSRVLADEVDAFVMGRMAKQHVPAVSIAVKKNVMRTESGKESVRGTRLSPGP